MISINLNDINMEEISRLACLFNLTTRNQYRVFGLIPSRPLHVLIEWSDYLHNGDNVFIKRELKMRNFMARMGMKYQFLAHPYHRNPVIKIGLRRDVREQPIFAACLLKTIIYTFEGLILNVGPRSHIHSKIHVPKLLP